MPRPSSEPRQAAATRSKSRKALEKARADYVRAPSVPKIDVYEDADWIRRIRGSVGARIQIVVAWSRTAPYPGRKYHPIGD